MMRQSPDAAPRYTLLTRAVHAGLGVAVVSQVLSSLLMEKPKPGQPESFFFEAHEYSGLAALGFACAFWAVVMLRRSGTERAALVPWFTLARRRVVWEDAKRHWAALKARTLPAHEDHDALASAIHGLGLLLITGMGVTGGLWLVAGELGLGRTTPVELLIEAHEVMSKLVWAYLIGHAGMGALHHYLGQASGPSVWAKRLSVECGLCIGIDAPQIPRRLATRQFRSRHESLAGRG